MSKTRLSKIFQEDIDGRLDVEMTPLHSVFNDILVVLKKCEIHLSKISNENIKDIDVEVS